MNPSFAVQYGSEREDAGRAPLVPFLRGCDFPEDVQVREEEAFFLVEPPPVGIIALVVVRHRFSSIDDIRDDDEIILIVLKWIGKMSSHYMCAY